MNNEIEDLRESILHLNKRIEVLENELRNGRIICDDCGKNIDVPTTPIIDYGTCGEYSRICTSCCANRMGERKNI